MCRGMPGLSVGYLCRVRDADLWDFCGACGKPSWLSQLGVQRLGASFRGGLAAKTSGLAVARKAEIWIPTAYGPRATAIVNDFRETARPTMTRQSRPPG